jgi:DNA polymerase
MIDVVLDGSYADFRRAVRPLLGHRVAPSRVQFRVRDVDPPGLFGGARPPVDGPPVSLPRRFVGLAGRATCFDAPDRYALAYRVAFRLLSDRTLLDDPGDDDVLALTRRAKHVARDVHKMHAFVRFRRVSRDGVPWWVAFHRPDHFVVARAVDHFVDRFGNDRFAILTPKGSASYTPPDGLTLGPPATDPGIDLGRFEQLWDTYYASIFNPARPMVEAMLAEMPRKHWATMPETRQIPRLLREARERVRASGERAGAGITLPDGLSLSDLAERVRGCDACPLADSGRPGVPGEGPVDAAIALVGEQPGDLEDQVGRPFVGPAGQLLDRALAAARARTRRALPHQHGQALPLRGARRPTPACQPRALPRGGLQGVRVHRARATRTARDGRPGHHRGPGAARSGRAAAPAAWAGAAQPRRPSCRRPPPVRAAPAARAR